MSLSSEPELLLWLILVTWPISAKRRSLKKGDKDSDFLSAKSTTGLSRSDANEGNFHQGLFDPLGATARCARRAAGWSSSTPRGESGLHLPRRETKTAGRLPPPSPQLFMKGILSFWCVLSCYLIRWTASLWWNPLAVNLFKSRVK